MKDVLPIDEAMPEILSRWKASPSLILSAAPGAGKTTRLPPELVRASNQAVWVLEPRRIAAISASQRIAEENCWELGKEVGYQVRFENRSSPQTKLLFLTEALLSRKLMADPELKGVGCVVLDEFHERSLHVDLALGALKELQELGRPDLKIVVMSATLDARPLAKFLGDAPVVDVPGRIFPLTTTYLDRAQLLRTGPDFTDRMKNLIVRAAAENAEGDILCFLPGRGEISYLHSALGDWAEQKNVAIFPLHGQLTLAEQKSALRPQNGRRKLILSTNVAESSLTVEGVRIVVDSGLARISQLHPRTGFESLDLVRISKASGTQRAGRAARRGPGRVYRAWMPYDELSMKEFEPPEVQRSDLTEAVLLLASLGVTKLNAFSWFELPPPRSLEQASGFLRSIDAIGDDGSLTPLGKRLRSLPVHPRLAKLLIVGQEQGRGGFAAELAALLSEPGKIPAGYEGENDLWLRWREWRTNPRLASVRRAADQLKSLIRADADEARPGHPEQAIADLLLDVYPDRLCRRRRPNDPQAKMAGGRGVKLHQDSSVKTSEFFLALDLSEGRDAAETLVFQAVGLSADQINKKILPLAKPAVHLEWDEERRRFMALETKDWNGLSVGSEHRRPADETEIDGKLAQLAFERWALVLQNNEDLASWFSRLRFLERKDAKFPPPSEEKIQDALKLACFGENSLEKVWQKDLVSFFEGLLESDHLAALERECPKAWTVPTGNRMKIRYSEEQGPSVEVRLQELFGLARGPVVAGQPLTLFLLAPNYRPVQVTRDLASFWKNGYPEVRKEMRARYPKHSWPDDPLTAPPQAKGRSTKS